MMHIYNRLDNFYLEKQPVGPAEVQRSECDILQGSPRSPKQHLGSAQEQRPEQSMSQGAARSPMIRTPIPDVSITSHPFYCLKF